MGVIERSDPIYCVHQFIEAWICAKNAREAMRDLNKLVDAINWVATLIIRAPRRAHPLICWSQCIYKPVCVSLPLNAQHLKSDMTTFLLTKS